MVSTRWFATSAEAIHGLRKRLVASDLRERLKLPGLDETRADIIVTGAVILDTLLQRLGVQELILCEWALREGISESLSATGMPHKNDIALPIAALEAFCAELDALLAAEYPGFELCLFGHIGDGNLHVNIMKPDALGKDEFLARTHEADRDMFELVRRHRGSISAEHGIGRMKRQELIATAPPVAIDLMRRIKAVLDPAGIMNPGKVI